MNCTDVHSADMSPGAERPLALRGLFVPHGSVDDIARGAGANPFRSMNTARPYRRDDEPGADRLESILLTTLFPRRVHRQQKSDEAARFDQRRIVTRRSHLDRIGGLSVNPSWRGEHRAARRERLADRRLPCRASRDVLPIEPHVHPAGFQPVTRVIRKYLVPTRVAQGIRGLRRDSIQRAGIVRIEHGKIRRRLQLAVLPCRSGVEEHDALVTAKEPACEEHACGGQGRGALGSGRDAFLACQHMHVGNHGRVVDRERGPAARADGLQDQVVADRRRHPQAAGDGLGVRPRLGVPSSRARRRARSERSRRPARRSSSGAWRRSSRAAPSRRTPSTCRRGPCRRPSDRGSRRAASTRAARPARSPSSSCPRGDTARAGWRDRTSHAPPPPAARARRSR